MFKLEFSRFLIAGGIAALANFLSRIGLNFVINYRLAVFLAYLIGMVVAYNLMKNYVFTRDEYAHKFQIGAFVGVNLLAVAQVWIISVALVEYLFPWLSFDLFAPEVAHLIGLSVPIVTSYLAHKHFTFREKELSK